MTPRAGGLRAVPVWVWFATLLPLLCFAGLFASALFLPSLVEEFDSAPAELSEQRLDPWGRPYVFEPAGAGPPRA